VRPTWLGFGVVPPFRPDESCIAQPLPNLQARSGPPPELQTTGTAPQTSERHR
jgi:hypothetical protein